MKNRLNNILPLSNETVVPKIELSNSAFFMRQNILNIQNYLFETNKAKIIKYFDKQNNLRTEKSLKMVFVNQRLDNSFALEYVGYKNTLYYISILGSIRVALVNNFSLEDFASHIPNFNFSVNGSYLLPSNNYNGKQIIPAVTIDRIEFNETNDSFKGQALSHVAHAARIGRMVDMPKEGLKLAIGIDEVSNINLMYDLNQNITSKNSTLPISALAVGGAAAAGAIAYTFRPEDGGAGDAAENRDLEDDQQNHNNGNNGNNGDNENGGNGHGAIEAGAIAGEGNNNQPNNDDNLGRINIEGRRVSARIYNAENRAGGNSPQADEADETSSKLSSTYQKSWNEYIADNIIPISITAFFSLGSLYYLSIPKNKITRDIVEQGELVTTTPPHATSITPPQSPRGYNSPVNGQLSAIHSPANSASSSSYSSLTHEGDVAVDAVSELTGQLIDGAVKGAKKTGTVLFDAMSETMSVISETIVDTVSDISAAMTPAQKPVQFCPGTEAKTRRKIDRKFNEIFQSPIRVVDNVKSGLDKFTKDKLNKTYNINDQAIKRAIDEFSIENLNKLQAIFPDGVYEAKAIEKILVDIFHAESILSDEELKTSINHQKSKNPDKNNFGYWYVKYHKSLKNSDPETVAEILKEIAEKLNLPEDAVLEILTSHNPQAANFSRVNDLLDTEICVAYLKYLKIAFLSALTFYQSELFNGAQGMELQGEPEDLLGEDDENENQDLVESEIKQEIYSQDANISKQRNNSSLAELVVENSPMYMATAANTIAPFAIATVTPDALMKPSLYLYSKVNHEIIIDSQMSGDSRTWIEFSQNIPTYFTNALKNSSLMELGKYLTDSFIAFGAVENIISLSKNAAIFGISFASNFLRAEPHPQFTQDTKFSLISSHLAEKHAFYVSSKFFIFAGYAVKAIGGNLLYPVVAENTEKWFDLLSTKTNSLFSVEESPEVITEDSFAQPCNIENCLTLNNSTTKADGFDQNIGVVYIPELEIYS